MKKSWASLVVLALIAWSQTVLAKVPPGPEWPGSEGMVLPITENSKLQVLNSRLGSRLLFNVALAKKQVELGAMGFGQKGGLPFISTPHCRDYEFIASLNGFRLLPASAGPLLSDQTLTLGLTYSCFSGKTPEGLALTHCVISPHAWAKELSDEADLKTAIAPFFYHFLTVENPTGSTQAGRLTFALQGELAEKRSGPLGSQVIALREPRTNALSRKPPELAIAAAEPDAQALTAAEQGFSFAFELMPGQRQTRLVILAGYTSEPVIKSKRDGSRHRFYYTRFWNSLDEVLSYALCERADILKRTAQAERTLSASPMPPEKKWFAALTFHSYLACTWLLTPAAGPGDPRFYVWEGAFRFFSTVDVAHEVEVLAYFMPWTLRLQLQEWATNQKKTRYGPYLMHDIGYDQTADISRYENPLAGILKLPPMPVEENANYSLLLLWYEHLTQDRETIAALVPTMARMVLANRDRDLDGNGIADQDTGTTFDVSDALHLAPNNVYLGIKELVAYSVAADFCDRYGCQDQSPAMRVEARKILETLKQARAKYGYLPVALDQSYQGWEQRSVVLGDGLLYPALTGFRSPEMDELIPILAEDFDQAVSRSTRPWGVVMTEGEPAIFFAKVMVEEPVSRYAYGKPMQFWEPFYRFNRDNPRAYNDGCYSLTEPWTGYEYSRGVVLFWELLPPPER
ncbi:MAG: hypothetical protein A2V67_17330 [Deltaproteobacteria bacterium RBG_13_61_14]|nr:MAG: hypothetical protein A2V67_17330 [Deltaproteobacteria bacterium RBG_13_61_14]